MRALILILAVAAASPAAAQPYLGLTQTQDAQRLAAEQALRNRDIALANEASATQARSQTDRALGSLSAARPFAPPAPLPMPSTAAPHAVAPVITLSQMAQIPDAALAKSNAEVLAAAANRR